MKRTKRLNTIIINTIALVLAILFIFPVYIMFLGAFKPETDIFDMNMLPNFTRMTFQNFTEVFHAEAFLHSILNSLIIASSVTAFALFFHSMAGYAFAKLRFIGKKALFIWYISTMMVPFAVIMIPLFQIIKVLGILNSLWAIILPAIPGAYGIFLYRQFFSDLPDSLIEAARIDGLSEFGIYRKIAIPLAKPITISLGISFFVANWNSYLWPLIVAQDKSLWTIQVAMSVFKGEHSTAWNLVLAGAVIAALPTILLFLIFQKYIRDGLMTSGMKL